jgi:WD40 repeat protein
MECSSSVRSIALQDKFNFLAVGLADGTIEIWFLGNDAPKRLYSQQFTHQFDQPFQHNYIEGVGFTDVDYTGAGFKLSAHTWGNVAYVIDMPNMMESAVTTIEYPAADQVIFSSRMSSNGKLLALGTSDGAVTIWEIATRNVIAKYLHDDQVQSVDFGSNNDVVISTGLDKTVKTFRISANAVVDTLNLGKESIALKVNYGGRRFVVGQGTRANGAGPFLTGEWRLNPGGKISSIVEP